MSRDIPPPANLKIGRVIRGVRVNLLAMKALSGEIEYDEPRTSNITKLLLDAVDKNAVHSGQNLRRNIFVF